MGKRKSNDGEGIVHSLTFSTYRRQRFFEDERVVRLFLESLEKARERYRFLVWAYVVMPEHIHLLVPPRGNPVSRILNSVKAPTSVRVIHHFRTTDPERLRSLLSGKVRGHSPFSFWQAGGGFDRDLHSPEEIWPVIRYIHLNPVRRKLAE